MERENSVALYGMDTDNEQGGWGELFPRHE